MVALVRLSCVCVFSLKPCAATPPCKFSVSGTHPLFRHPSAWPLLFPLSGVSVCVRVLWEQDTKYWKQQLWATHDQVDCEVMRGMHDQGLPVVKVSRVESLRRRRDYTGWRNATRRKRDTPATEGLRGRKQEEYSYREISDSCARFINDLFSFEQTGLWVWGEHRHAKMTDVSTGFHHLRVGPEPSKVLVAHEPWDP